MAKLDLVLVGQLITIYALVFLVGAFIFRFVVGSFVPNFGLLFLIAAIIFIPLSWLLKMPQEIYEKWNKYKKLKGLV